MPKQHSTRCTPAKRRSVSKSAAAVVKKRSVNGVLSPEENIKKYISLARGLVLAAWPDIVQGLISKSINGSYQQAKLLLDLCDLTNAETSRFDQQERQQLCDVLLDGLMMSSTHPEGSMTKAELSRELKNTGTP